MWPPCCTASIPCGGSEQPSPDSIPWACASPAGTCTLPTVHKPTGAASWHPPSLRCGLYPSLLTSAVCGFHQAVHVIRAHCPCWGCPCLWPQCGGLWQMHGVPAAFSAEVGEQGGCSCLTRLPVPLAGPAQPGGLGPYLWRAAPLSLALGLGQPVFSTELFSLVAAGSSQDRGLPCGCCVLGRGHWWDVLCEA